MEAGGPRCWGRPLLAAASSDTSPGTSRRTSVADLPATFVHHWLGRQQPKTQSSSSESILSKVRKSFSMVVKSSLHKGAKCKEKECPCQKDNQKGCQQRYAQKLATETPAPNQPAPPAQHPLQEDDKRKSSSSSSLCCSECDCELCKETMASKSSLNKAGWVNVLKEREATRKAATKPLLEPSEDEADERPTIQDYYGPPSEPDLSDDSDDRGAGRHQAPDKPLPAPPRSSSAGGGRQGGGGGGQLGGGGGGGGGGAPGTRQRLLHADMDTTPALSGEDLRLWVDRNLLKGREIVAEAVWDNPGLEPEGLQFRAGDAIHILRTEEHNWWWGIRNMGRDDQELGRFPTAAVRDNVQRIE
ncbi:hypothetical protein FOCC_FOCC001575 [Frankliniella occidentalis]|nr:hypothetical protein FOCC_FOCC001575 [Frankliniella occidentalis]